jgi:hypothetical protein
MRRLPRLSDNQLQALPLPYAVPRPHQSALGPRPPMGFTTPLTDGPRSRPTANRLPALATLSLALTPTPVPHTLAYLLTPPSNSPFLIPKTTALEVSKTSTHRVLPTETHPTVSKAHNLTPRIRPPPSTALPPVHLRHRPHRTT